MGFSERKKKEDFVAERRVVTCNQSSSSPVEILLGECFLMTGITGKGRNITRQFVLKDMRKIMFAILLLIIAKGI